MKRYPTRRFFAVFAAALLGGTAFARAEDGEKNLFEIAKATENLKTFVKAVKVAGLVETLTGTTKYTVFAPSDEAFMSLGEGNLETLLSGKDPAALGAILKLHIVPALIHSSKIKDTTVKTLSGNDVGIFADGEDIGFGSAIVELKDLTASNGVLHVIDTVVKVYGDED